MAKNEGFSGEHFACGSFSHLLFSDEVVGLDTADCFNYSSSFRAENPQKMLCFGHHHPSEFNLQVAERTRITAQKSGVTCSDSSSASSTNNGNTNSLSKSNVSCTKTTTKIKDCLRKRNESGSESADQNLNAGGGIPVGSERNCKKNRSDDSTVSGHAKVRKEKLGERITALQQLVSPFGKTDTASVLHEAMGYIRFLHDQVQVLCSPYLQRLPSSACLHEGGENGEGESRKELRSRGLCLVPVECTVHVDNNNGADFWSPAMGVNSTLSKH
ncbi:hypothetical protein F0562_020738 [Nyssa sinensis]|uniref:BHLH domain-containing protein n=1 Tax=Nyssa sinensis TaxID=561372 RepID=A0A5J5BWW0_9ASTE|nr:hypothetical protein F0562_020738 [Nyssa sinensis]